MSDVRIAVLGAGTIGSTHIASIAKADGARLAAIVDPTDRGAEVAATHGVPHLREVDPLLGNRIADGAIVATPNETHVPLATALLNAGLPALVEKPVANSIAEGAALQSVVDTTGVPLLVGHHRRYNPMIRAVRDAIDDGRFGRLVTANILATMAKPQSYFDVGWRIAPDTGGPLLLNLIHEIDMLRFFFGEVSRVSGRTSNAERGNPVEDTAAAILDFADGGIATLTVTDAGCGPWSYDLASGESPRLPRHDISAHVYAGTRAGISLPDASIWKHPGDPDWFTEMRRSPLDYRPADPFVAQIEHFAAVIRDGVLPIVRCADGVANMRVISAIKDSAARGHPVAP